MYIRTFADLINEILKKYTISEFSEETMVSEKTIRNWKVGKTKEPQDSTYQEVINFLKKHKEDSLSREAERLFGKRKGLTNPQYSGVKESPINELPPGLFSERTIKRIEENFPDEDMLEYIYQILAKRNPYDAAINTNKNLGSSLAVLQFQKTIKYTMEEILQEEGLGWDFFDTYALFFTPEKYASPFNFPKSIFMHWLNSYMESSYGISLHIFRHILWQAESEREIIILHRADGDVERISIENILFLFDQDINHDPEWWVFNYNDLNFISWLKSLSTPSDTRKKILHKYFSFKIEPIVDDNDEEKTDGINKTKRLNPLTKRILSIVQGEKKPKQSIFPPAELQFAIKITLTDTGKEMIKWLEKYEKEI